MSEREPITTELRRYMEAYEPTVDGEHVEIARIGTIGYGGFVEHCDAIDAIHAGLERENAELRRQLDSLTFESKPMTDENMAESGWVRLPLDADGVPIHVGDEVVDELDESTEPRKVTSLYLANDGWWVYIGGIGCRPSRYRHHQAPTVEDVLTKFGIDWEYEDNCEDRAALLAEYAAKLRLAGDAE